MSLDKNIKEAITPFTEKATIDAVNEVIGVINVGRQVKDLQEVRDWLYGKAVPSEVLARHGIEGALVHIDAKEKAIRRINRVLVRASKCPMSRAMYSTVSKQVSKMWDWVKSEMDKEDKRERRRRK
jgi:hypothetical protein